MFCFYKKCFCEFFYGYRTPVPPIPWEFNKAGVNCTSVCNVRLFIKNHRVRTYTIGVQFTQDDPKLYNFGFKWSWKCIKIDP